MVNHVQFLSSYFLNDQFEQETVWGPRANEVQKFVTDVRADNYRAKIIQTMQI